MVNTIFREADHLYIANFTGKVSLQDIRQYISELEQVPEYISRLNVIHDFRQAEESLQPHLINEMFAIIREPLSRFSKIRVASVHEKPQTTAISTIVKQRLNLRQVEYKIYCSMDSALGWIRIKQSVQRQAQN